MGCGKAATLESGGASGFGIGFGYSEDESIVISDCASEKNKKFGFFLEHQGRFNREKYSAVPIGKFIVKNCFASENLFGFGGINASNTVYEECVSENSLRYGFYFEYSVASGAVGCKSRNEKEACFAVLQNLGFDEASAEKEKICFSHCEGESTPVGVLSLGEADPSVENCVFREVECEIKIR